MTTFVEGRLQRDERGAERRGHQNGEIEKTIRLRPSREGEDGGETDSRGTRRQQLSID
jgi:hypothetical protein